jgi:hypothetical protein
MEPPVATGYDPLRDTAPELARTMVAAVQHRIAFGERAGQHVRRIGSGFGTEGEAPRLTGPRCASVNGFSLQANTAVPAHRRDQLEQLIRYGINEMDPPLCGAAVISHNEVSASDHHVTARRRVQ